MSSAAPESVDFLVVGAGMAGLTAAMRLEDAIRGGRVRSYLVAEASPEPGGMVRTSHLDGYLIEDGPDMFFAEKPEVTELAGRLGLSHELIETNPDVRRSFIAVNGRLEPLPTGFFLTAPSQLRPFLVSGIIGPIGKLRMAMEPFVKPKRTAEDETVGAFVRRRFGRAALARIAQPMIGGIYAGDPDRLSAKWAMPKFVEWERRCGSVVWGMKRKGSDPALGKRNAGPRYSMFQSFRSGMGTLPRAMAASLGPGRLRLGAPVRELRPIEGGWSADVAGREVRARSVILTLSAQLSARLTRPFAADLADHLSRLRYESCAIIQAGWLRSRVRHRLDGMGFVVPAEDGLPLMAGSFSSVKFEGRASKDKVLFRFFAGGAFGKDWMERSEKELWSAVRSQAGELLGLEGEPDFTKTLYHHGSMPQYEVGHDSWVERLRAGASRYTGLYLCGMMMDGVGIPDTVRAAGAAADEAVEKFKERV